ncbi:hypothetical protein HDV05_002483, partial [Chytridiales sp. JEL 0842]
LQKEKDSYLALTLDYSLLQTEISKLRSNAKQSDEKMRAYMEMSEDRQRLLLSHTEKMQSYVIKRLVDSEKVSDLHRRQMSDIFRVLREVLQLKEISANLAESSKDTALMKSIEIGIKNIEATLKHSSKLGLDNTLATDLLSHASVFADAKDIASDNHLSLGFEHVGFLGRLRQNLGLNVAPSPTSTISPAVRLKDNSSKLLLNAVVDDQLNSAIKSPTESKSLESTLRAVFEIEPVGDPIPPVTNQVDALDAATQADSGPPLVTNDLI